MSLSSRLLRRSVVSLLWMGCGACAAQANPGLTSLGMHGITAAVGAKASAAAAGARVGFAGVNAGQVVFPGAQREVGALGDFDGDGVMDYAFALSPAVAGGDDLCVYYGSGVEAGGSGAAAGDGPAFSGGDAYPPTGGRSGCGAFPIVGGKLPAFAYMAAVAFKAGGVPGLIVEDSANGTIYVLGVEGAGEGVGLPGLAVKATMAIGVGDGVGPIFVGDFNGDGKMDFIVDGESGGAAWVYLGNGDGTFETPVRYGFDQGVKSMAVGDVDGDGRADLVVEGEDGGVEVFHGNTDGSFARVSEGGFAAGVGGAVSGAMAMAVADVDGDGCGDVAMPYRGGDGANALDVWYGRCDGTFGTPQVVALERGYSMAAVADVDGDGLPDVALSDGAVVSVLYGLGKRSFSAEEQVYAEAGITSLAVRDVNRDGLADLVVSSGAATLGGYGVATAGAGGVAVLLNGTKAAARPAAKPAATATTSTTLYLCTGPTALCPSSGFVMPPFSATLTMVYGQTYNGTALVTASDGGALPGNILFYDDYNGTTALLCTLVAATAGSCPATVGTGAMVGTHVFTAVYAPVGDPVHSGSTSGTVTLTVSQDSTTATVVGAPSSSPAGQPVTLTATVTGLTAPSGFVGLYAPPSGTVMFLDGTTLIGPGTLVPDASGVSSTATLTTSSLPVGTDPITATYGGDTDFSGSAAGVFNETITPPLTGSFTIAATPATVSIGVGDAAQLTVTVAALNGFAFGVNLSCNGLPTEATCTFVYPLIPAGGGTTALLLGTTAPHSCGTTQPYFLGGNGGGPGLGTLAAPVLAGLIAVFVPGRRRWLRGLIALAAVAAAMQMTGCGHCTDLGTKPGTYTIQVVGSSVGTSEVESQAVTLNVTL